MNDLSDRHPSCVHSNTHHNTMSMSDQYSAVGSSSCTCEECSRYKLPHQSEQSDMLLQQHANNAMSSSSSAHDRGISTSSTMLPTTYLARRSSTVNTAMSPKMQPAGFGLGGSTSYVHPPQRRASLEFHNRERSFQQHSTACDCQGSGVGCGCSFTCDC